METLTNAASAARTAIFGESTNNSSQPAQEPVSGELGDTTKGEPYDAGNSDSTKTEPTNLESNTKTTASELPTREKTDTFGMASTEPKTDSSDMTTTAPKAMSDAPGNTLSTNPVIPEKEHDKTGAIDAPNPSSAFGSDKPTSSNEPTSSGAEPSVSANPSSGVQDIPKQQGADRPEQEPSKEENKGIREAKKEAEEAKDVDVSGPGPVPLEQRGKTGGASKPSGGDDDGPQKESHGEGTGEKYVKSSGMKAEGGDFDAANPGAGKEADRLLEEKGIHPGQGQATEDSGPSEDTSESKKPSLKEKIKAKLHKH